jgi:small-conductance mechanosensitive channel
MGITMGNSLSHEIYTNLVNTLLAFLVLVITYVVVNFIIVQKLEGGRHKRNFRIRSFYVVCVIFLFLIARIWVEGLTHLLAGLIFVSAALVVANKETIMNFVGCLIITWRELFAENDLIQIQQYKGYVKSMGVLYFSLSEVSEGINGDITGRIIRVPNGLAANNAIINFSQTSHLLEQKFTITITQDSEIESAITFMNKLVNATILEIYKEKKEFTVEYLSRWNKDLAHRMNLEAKVSIQPKLDKPSGVEVITRYYCFSQDAEKIQQKIWLSLLNSVKEQEEFKLSYN